MKTSIENHKCSSIGIKYVQDALEVLNGSWKLPILAALTEGPKRFKEIAKAVDGISDKMLSKELRHLEMNQLIKRTVYETFPPSVEYSITEHTASLYDVLNALSEWGLVHRQRIIGKEYSYEVDVNK